jgi:hypothetical protein
VIQGRVMLRPWPDYRTIAEAAIMLRKDHAIFTYMDGPRDIKGIMDNMDILLSMISMISMLIYIAR